MTDDQTAQVREALVGGCSVQIRACYDGKEVYVDVDDAAPWIAACIWAVADTAFVGGRSRRTWANLKPSVVAAGVAALRGET